MGRRGVAADCPNARTRRAWLCFVDESGVKLTPPVRRTWAPKGRTPVLRHPYRRGKQISMCGLVAYRPGQDDQDEPAAWMGFDLLEGAYDTRQFIRVLDCGAVAAGFDSDLWTLARIAEVIEQTTGVAHHPGHVWRILKEMRWSLQRPARKAVERNEAEIARWVAEEWPRIVQTPERAEPGSASWMNRASS